MISWAIRKIILFLIAITSIALVFINHISFLNTQSNSVYDTEVVERSEVYESEITRGSTSTKEVIFTFDAGGTVESADAILKALEKHHIKGTFFLTGKIIEKYPDLVKLMVSSGHEVFNHTYDHKDMTKLSDNDMVSELTKTEDLLKATVGTSTKLYFRAPYGMVSGHVLETIEKIGYRSIRWTVDAWDWKEHSGIRPWQVKNRIMSKLAPGNIYLMHVSDGITGAILDDVFTSIEKKGYKIVSLTQGL